MITVTGIDSVIDRTLFTNKGPIVKKPLPLLTGSNLRIVTEQVIEIPTATFVSADVGYQITITGTPAGRNDGTFTISEVISSTQVRLSNTNFDVSDVSATTSDIVALANELRSDYELHRTQKIDLEGDGVLVGVHGTDDTINLVVAPVAVDLATALTLLNDLKTKVGSHVVDISATPQVHEILDPTSIAEAPVATNLPSALYLVNDLRRKYESHRQKRDVHQTDDSVNRIALSFVRVTKNVYPGPLTGPFNWTMFDPRLGMIADDPTDVNVTVNGSSAAVDAVFGLLGAVVLQTKPASLDTVLIDYEFLNNPPSPFLRLNSYEYTLNQQGNSGLSGLPQHQYRARSYLADNVDFPDFRSAFSPTKIGWKYKGIERAYSSILNDPNSLLLNVPTNKLYYPVLFEKVHEVTIKYDPTSLPQNLTDPWTLNGQGSFSLAPGGNELTIIDQDTQTGPDSMPPYFHHNVDLDAPSIVSSAFRALVVDDSSLELDGVFTGVSFGFSNGRKVILVGFILTEATNLTSAVVLANDLKLKFDAHLSSLNSHVPDDTSEIINIVDATDLNSLIILCNEIKTKYTSHISKGSGVGLVHQLVDSTNVITSPNATDLNSSIALLNEIRVLFNSHREQSGVHFVNDSVNTVSLIKQVGVLTNQDFPEFQNAWTSFAHDWTEYSTYRVFIDTDGSAQVFRSGDTDPSAIVALLDLPALSDIDGDFDSAQQVFFGPIGRESKNTSKWQFVRVNITPVDGNLIENNKSVNYAATVVPELDSSPWITVGQEGFEKIISPGTLLLESTASTPDDDVEKYGMTSSNFRGFVRFEPILTIDTSASLEFSFSADYYTSGLDNSSMAVVLDDENFSIQLAFLQFSPSEASTTGSTTEPYLIIAGDDLILRINNDPTITITFLVTDITAATVVNRINAAVGYTMASAVSGKIKLVSPGFGSTSTFEIISGSAISKLGLSAGFYAGLDSSPEPRISWFGGNFPNLDSPVWNVGGNQQSTMLGRTMRITDIDTSDFRTYSLSDILVTNKAFNSTIDWKLDFKVKVLSYQSGSELTAAGPYSNLFFSGVLVSVDEGSTGKNVELHFSTDSFGNTYLNLVSYNQGTNSLDVKAQYAFTWNDGEEHSYNIFTSKSINSILVLADGQVLTPTVGPAPTYTGLNTGVVESAISFGSGSEPVVNADLKSSRSVVDWGSVSIFKDSKINDPSSSSKRYVGIYQGGDPAVFNSYALHQIDWTVSHVYRLVRNPITSVSLYIDGSPTPSISIAYDVINLPSSSSSFLKEVSNTKSVVGFGSFNPSEISRTRWGFIRYSIGKITLTNGLVPQHAYLNRHNMVASPDHLFTQKSHTHAGFTVYSGGTPVDDFMADDDVEAFTQLGEGTPPVPMTQDIESRGGFNKIATLASSVPSIDFVNSDGYLSDLDNDVDNTIVAPTATDLPTSIVLVNDIRSKYLSHLTQYRVHLANDTKYNGLTTEASDLLSSMELANLEKEMFNKHRTATIREIQKVHSSDDSVNVVTTADATDLPSLMALLNDISTQYEAHRTESGVHGATLFIRLDPPNRSLYNNMKFYRVESGIDNLVSPFSDDETLYMGSITYGKNASMSYTADVLPENAALYDTILLANDLRSVYEGHRVEAGVHVLNDAVNAIVAPVATDLATVITLLIDIKDKFNSHITQTGVHLDDDLDDIILGTDPTVLKMAQSLANEISMKFSIHGLNTSVHLIEDAVNKVSASDTPPIADPGWIQYNAGPGTPGVSLQTSGPLNVLRYETVSTGPVETVYKKNTHLPDSPSIDGEMTVSMRINAFSYSTDVDTGIYAGILSDSSPGVSVAIGFDAIANIPYVKLQDVNTNKPVFRVPFNWADGAFHTYKIVKNSKTGTISLVIVS